MNRLIIIQERTMFRRLDSAVEVCRRKVNFGQVECLVPCFTTTSHRCAVRYLLFSSVYLLPLVRYRFSATALLAASSENFTGSLQLKSFDWFSSDGPLVTSENDIL